MQNVLLDQGVSLMLNGMGTVVVFLTVLVLTTTVMSSLVQKLFPEQEIEEKPKTVAPVSSDNGIPSAPVLAAIKAAIEQHRNR